MNPTTLPIYQELSIDLIHMEIDHGSNSFGVSALDQWMLRSIEELGILMPILVTQEEAELYRIFDGCRRYQAAFHLGLATLPCLVRPKLSRAERELLRFQLQMTYKPLTQAEQRAVLERIES